MAPTESKDEVKKEAVHSSTGSPKRRVSDFDIYMYGESYVNSSAYYCAVFTCVTFISFDRLNYCFVYIYKFTVLCQQRCINEN